MNRIAERLSTGRVSADPAGEPAGVINRLAQVAMAGLAWAVDSRQREIDQIIARRLAQSGGRLSDDLERRIMGDIVSTAFGSRRDTDGVEPGQG